MVGWCRCGFRPWKQVWGKLSEGSACDPWNILSLVEDHRLPHSLNDLKRLKVDKMGLK